MITNFQIGIDPTKTSMLLNTKNEAPKLYLKDESFMLNASAVQKLKFKLTGKDRISFVQISNDTYLINSKNIKLADIGKSVLSTGGKFSFAPMYKLLKREILESGNIENFDLVHSQQIIKNGTTINALKLIIQ